MSTEYRRGIPSAAHVEAATRLRLLWQRSDEAFARFRKHPQTSEVLSCHSNNLTSFFIGRIPCLGVWPYERDLSYRPIRTDGTPVDWEVLDAEAAGTPLRNFAAVLDAVAEQRVAARQEQSAQPSAAQVEYAQRDADATAAMLQTVATPEPRSFADVRPDRHGWRWWRQTGRDSTDLGQRFETLDGRCRWRSAHADAWFVPDTANPQMLRYTVIPTDEQGNPVSWESIVQGRNAVQTVAGRDVEEDRPRLAEQRIPAFMPSPGMAAAIEASQLNEQRLAENPELWREAQRQAASSPRTTEAIYQDLLARHRARMSGGATTFSNSFNQPLTYEGLEQVLRDMRAIDNASPKNPTGQPAQPVQPTPLPRFTVDELGDVDHSATTTQDSAILKRGKLPTVEAIGKYREVMAKRNGTVAEAVKASGIDCEVAQYVLERWVGGLSDDLCLWLLRAVGKYCRQGQQFTQRRVDELAQQELADRPTLDTSEPADTTAQRQRAEAAERQARTAALQTQLAKERAAREAELVEEPTRFSLLEVDEAADPARSIEAWKVQRAANERRARNTVHPVTAATPKPTLAPRRKPFEVVDVEADGLSGGTAFAVLLSRAMNQNC